MNRKWNKTTWMTLAAAMLAGAWGCESGQTAAHQSNSSFITNYSLKPSPVTGYTHQGASSGPRSVADAPTE